MYTETTMLTKDRYSYNGYKVLNINPNHLPDGDIANPLYINTCKNYIYNNVENLISNLSDQFTSCQKACL